MGRGRSIQMPGLKFHKKPYQKGEKSRLEVGIFPNQKEVCIHLLLS